MTDPVTRRNFMRYAGLGILALSLPRLPPSFLERNDYCSKELGFSFEKPSDWRWVSAAELDEGREKAILPGGDEAKREAIELAGLPLLIATKYPQPQRGPTLVLWRQPAMSWQHAGADNVGFAKEHTRSYRLYRQWLKDYHVQKARPTTFARLPGSCCVATFVEEDNEGGSWPVRLESNMIRWRDSWLTFNFLDLKTGWDSAARADFTAIATSLSFV